MCIFFKNKIKIANNTDIMSSTIIKNAKLDSKIEIPEGFIGLIYYYEKHLFSLPEGSYKLNDENFLLVRDKNAKRNQKKKNQNFNFNIHYVTTNDSDIEISCKKQTKLSPKQTYILRANFSISNSSTFASTLLANWYKTNNARTNKYVTIFFQEFFEYILRKNLTTNCDQLYNTANKYFKKYGIKINCISLSNENNNSFFNQSLNNLVDANNSNLPYNQNINNGTSPQNTLQNNAKQLDFNLPKIENKVKYCPKCQSKQIEGSPYCHICGATINNLIKKD